MSRPQSATASLSNAGSVDVAQTETDLLAQVDLASVAALIAVEQYPTGEIPWCRGEKTDPWDHVEAAIGLTIAGRAEAARKAFFWMQAKQLPDGSWYAAYNDGKPLDRTKDANMTAYIAVGLFHHWLVNRDRPFLERMWPTLKGAMAFVLSMQGPQGQIYWARNPEGRIDKRALLTGSSSIFMSLKCALAVAKRLERQQPQWDSAAKRLGNAISTQPHLFDVSKARYSMDWFYPILSGAVQGTQAQARIDKYWSTFVLTGQGVRCVSDQPWITIAETCELALSLRAMGQKETAGAVFNWVSGKKYADGAYWCGHTCPDMQIWPEDKLTWTNAVVLMVADALHHLTPGSTLFNHDAWNGLDFIGHE